MTMRNRKPMAEYVDDDFTCRYCDAGFQQESDLEEHICDFMSISHLAVWQLKQLIREEIESTKTDT